MSLPTSTHAASPQQVPFVIPTGWILGIIRTQAEVRPELHGRWMNKARRALEGKSSKESKL